VYPLHKMVKVHAHLAAKRYGIKKLIHQPCFATSYPTPHVHASRHSGLTKAAKTTLARRLITHDQTLPDLIKRMYGSGLFLVGHKLPRGQRIGITHGR
jgi:hypothetical protein